MSDITPLQRRMAKVILGKDDNEIDSLIDHGPTHLTASERVLYNDPDVQSTSHDGVYDPNCYICNDPDFARMGLPLCYPCPKCVTTSGGKVQGHIAADDTRCTVCGYDMFDDDARATKDD